MGGNNQSRPTATQQLVTRDLLDIMVSTLQQFSNSSRFLQEVIVDCREFNESRDRAIKDCLRVNNNLSSAEVESKCFQIWERLRCEANNLQLAQSILVNTNVEQQVAIKNEITRALEAQLETNVTTKSGLLVPTNDVTTAMNNLIEMSVEIWNNNWQTWGQDANVVQRLQVNGAPVNFIQMNQTATLLADAFQESAEWNELSQTVTLTVQQAIAAQDRNANIIITVTAIVIGLSFLALLIFAIIKLVQKQNAKARTKLRIQVDEPGAAPA
ncbi:unnamed protein product [Rotaria magnacalcarata]|uniref:Uncharacterized protein n=1 Tax=Rotaria magnacalcarata TaxID=392030 RepID=A0A816GK32_9BILA|nr:unnamed protein product [Rotaria magnacalcarata]CAF4886684.1 unnamed protein product [Rotaria magnacalcarata]